MTPAPATGAASPLIAGAGMASGDFRDLDDDFNASNLFDFSNSPDTLQSLEKMDQKAFLNPQELTAGPLPDSPNDSYHDSSSESASSTKRTGSSESAKTPAHTITGDGLDIKMDWANPEYASFDDDENAFTLTDHSTMMDGIYSFADNEDSFIDQSFDFEGASSSPEAPLTVQMNMPSPGMPIIKTSSPRKTGNAHGAKVGGGHKKRASQLSMAFSVNGTRPTSRDVSPMSALVTSHDSSPAATLFNSPSPSVIHDLTRNINGNVMWPSKLEMARPDHMSVSMPYGGAMPQPAVALHQQLRMFGSMPFNFNGGYELRIMPTPLKSRVETQIPIKMTLLPLPPGVTKLHLPGHTISKPKLLAKPPPERSPDTLELYVTLVCTSAMEQPGMKQKALERATKLPQGHLPDVDDEHSPQNGGDVRICQGCITRERKRAARKKIKKPEEEKLWSLDEERRVIVFNTQEIKEWQPLSGVVDSSGRPEAVVSNRAMQIDAPMRIACYCRHHNEKMGFNVIFTIKDYQDRVIAQAMSNPIMITDDHKTHPMAGQSSQQAMSDTVTSSTVPMGPDSNTVMSPTQMAAFCVPPSNGDVAMGQANGQQASYHASPSSSKTTPTMSSTPAPTRAMSRPASPSLGGPASKKRKSSGSGSSRVPNGLTMTRLETSPPPPAPAPQTAAGPQLSAAASPFSPKTASFSQLDQVFGQPPFTNGPPTPSGSNEHAPLFSANRSASMDNLAMAQLYSAPTSKHGSRAPSPSALPQNQFGPSLASGLFPLSIGVSQTRPPPMIHKIIPNEGPKMGGIEVTVLGQAFFQGLEVWFGDQKATTTTYWGDSSLVCLLPPSPVAGAVAVTFKHQGVPGAQTFPMAKEPPIFKYIDDNENKLIRTALSVLGHKMSGQMVDVSDLARRILNDGNSAWTGPSSMGPSSGGTGFSHASQEHLESQLLRCLDLIDLDDSAHKTQLDLKRPTGHTMLHLACSIGYHRFVAALLARGANPDARDRGGYTPLHMAAIHNRPEIARRLMIAGADPTVRSLSGLTAADVAQSRLVLRAIHQSERRSRSFSGASLRSRASSNTSLRSLLEPLARAQTHDEPIALDAGEESPEYTSGDFEDEDPDEDCYVDAKRPMCREQEEKGVQEWDQDDKSDDLNGPESPTTQLAAIKEALRDNFQQPLHQFQQSMALHLQNLAQMPQMPTFPGIPMLPDYQAYLQQAPFVRRMQQLMPGSGPRPEAAEEGGKLDGRWWDILSYMQSSAAPPAYEDIFGRQSSDTKQECAIRAAADAEADMKCSAMYDKPMAGVETEAEAAETGSRSRANSPGVLKIGRKNAITKEQQEQFLRAHEKKLKKISSDRNLFFIWSSGAN
ncbi:hypothetical protein CDD82_5716 [Ophiocordyceps australis]|uniref:IPT/TIG domain-containing protein n=1 Tax=Ophiocordyceps australis TaxID=1399860 RepID=A0A2C5Z1D9_9HYPO|nr:hypothetical protein CDD82_5716 [Ophiocordyceps australis]